MVNDASGPASDVTACDTVVPRVDVLIPAYNAEQTLVQSIASIQTQTLTDLKIVVIDDGSSDATADMLAAMAREDQRIEVVTQPNGGIVSALNAGLAHCRSLLIARHDADDIAFPVRIAEQLAYMDEHPDCVAVGANAWHIDATGRRIGTISNYGGAPVYDPSRLPAREPYLMHPFLMVRRQALVAVGGYRYVHHAEDADLYWRLLESGRLFGLEAALGEYRFSPESVSSTSIVNGRIQAVSSQLAALSFRRRANGVADLDFPKERKAAYQAATTLGAILAVASQDLTAEETVWLGQAAPLKLLEQALYRPYRLDREDYGLARHALKVALASSDEEQNWHARQLQAKTVAQLLRQKRLGTAAGWAPALLGARPLLDLWRATGRAKAA